jgi:ankyrin repeat protein
MTRTTAMTPAPTAAEERRYAELQAMALGFARRGETDALAAMIAHGLPVNLADAKGQALLMLASYHGHQETTRMLLESGAEVDRPNHRGQPPLAGADANADQGGGMTPLGFAALFGRTEAVKLLQAHRASLPRRQRTHFLTRCLLAASHLVAGLRRILPTPTPTPTP